MIYGGGLPSGEGVYHFEGWSLVPGSVVGNRILAESQLV
jgi:hypothetical protein